MKFLTPQITYLLTQRESRQDLRALLRYLAFLTATIAGYSAVFHLLMIYEGQEHSWITGVYWTLTVMSTLGFGDITFQSDAGRFFSIVVLLSGIVLLLIVLPFAFIRFFYAPWLEAQIRLRAPREVSPAVSGHVLILGYDEVAAGLASKLDDLDVPCYVVESDPTTAANLLSEGVRVVTGEFDSVETYQALRAEHAKLVVANLSDAENSNVALTVRERYPNVRIAAFAEEMDSVDVLELSGASDVVPLKHRLGEYLASRVSVGPARAHLVGRFKELRIAEFPVEQTGLSGRAIRDTHLRELTGLNIVACWERGHLIAARPDTMLTDHSVAVLVGTPDQIAELDALFVIYNANDNPVLVIGGGKVGRATSQALRQREVAVNLIERDATLRSALSGSADHVTIGDASDRNVIMKAGLEDAPSVVLTTNDDATNIFLAVYCRRLNPDIHIISRITHERNLDAISRAGADSVLSYSTLGVKSLLAMVLGSEATFVGEGVDLLVEPVPPSLAGKQLIDAQIVEKTGMNVLAIQSPDGSALNAIATTELEKGSDLVMLGTREQRDSFREAFA
ncbi:MAG: NAD-binding protein [Myxococcales bacterium]|nr:NAD-binding protein [Myxococcales bacterium]